MALFVEKKGKSSHKQHPINHDQQKRIPDLTAQKRVEIFGLGLFYGFQILEKQKEKPQEHIGINGSVLYGEINGEADKRPTDEQAMVYEGFLQAHFHHEAVLARSTVVLIIAHVVDVEHGIGEEAHGRGGQQNAEIERFGGQIKSAEYRSPAKKEKTIQVAEATIAVWPFAQGIKQGSQHCAQTQGGKNGQFLPREPCEDENQKCARNQAQGGYESHAALHFALGDAAALHLALRPYALRAVGASLEVAVVVG